MQEEVLNIIVRECRLDEAPALSTPLAGLDADSIDVVCVIGALEERFGIEFPLGADPAGIESVGDIVTMVERRIAGRGAAAPESAAPR